MKRTEPTGSGSAEMAISAEPGLRATGAVAGYRPERTLRLRVELRRQFKRRRTMGVLALMAALPLLLIGALQLGGSAEAEQISRTLPS